jgi:hypothetical protein
MAEIPQEADVRPGALSPMFQPGQPTLQLVQLVHGLVISRSGAVRYDALQLAKLLSCRFELFPELRIPITSPMCHDEAVQTNSQGVNFWTVVYPGRGLIRSPL